mgnify:CR=1 FL=1
MPIPSSINDLSTTAGSNSPAGSESPSLIDDYLRTYASYIAQLRDRTDTPVTPALGGVGTGYIDGLIPIWVTATEILVTAGSAYIPSLGRCVTAAAASLSGLSLTGNTWYYLYIYDSAGVPTYEMSTTAPGATYSGTARTKGGGNSRRFICALRSGSSALRPFVWAADYVTYTDGAALYPILSNGLATSPTVVSGTAVIPLTTQRALLQVYAAAGNSFSIGPEAVQQILSVTASTRVLAPVISRTDQLFVYTHAGTVTGGTSLDIRGYGSER